MNNSIFTNMNNNNTFTNILCNIIAIGLLFFGIILLPFVHLTVWLVKIDRWWRCKYKVDFDNTCNGSSWVERRLAHAGRLLGPLGDAPIDKPHPLFDKLRERMNRASKSV